MLMRNLGWFIIVLGIILPFIIFFFDLAPVEYSAPEPCNPPECNIIF